MMTINLRLERVPSERVRVHVIIRNPKRNASENGCLHLWADEFPILREIIRLGAAQLADEVQVVVEGEEHQRGPR